MHMQKLRLCLGPRSLECWRIPTVLWSRACGDSRDQRSTSDHADTKCRLVRRAVVPILVVSSEPRFGARWRLQLESAVGLNRPCQTFGESAGLPGVVLGGSTTGLGVERPWRYTTGNFVRYMKNECCARALTLPVYLVGKERLRHTPKVRSYTGGSLLLQVTRKWPRRGCRFCMSVSPQGVKKNRANDGNYADRDGPRGEEWHRQRKGARGAIGRPKNRPALVLLWGFRPTADLS